MAARQPFSCRNTAFPLSSRVANTESLGADRTVCGLRSMAWALPVISASRRPPSSMSVWLASRPRSEQEVQDRPTSALRLQSSQ
ncbi:hypothetical protein PV359_33440 [Streptomyces stelliscabiei]|uniref:hypothetical protein n=1 Tax=Streptomyces stelliscabiei TaxID=146820 RepID=UPI001F16F548|nr:hypothetical protein [Streptomyces stelliscabiei]MDX2665604.1 hypothetical protein [Streptomyces stelliscabiei]